MKKISLLLLVSVMVLSTFMFPMVASAETQRDDQNLSLEPDYYQEKGQISLDGLNVSLDKEGEIVLAGKDNNAKKRVLDELASSENLTELIQDSV